MNPEIEFRVQNQLEPEVWIGRMK